MDAISALAFLSGGGNGIGITEIEHIKTYLYKHESTTDYGEAEFSSAKDAMLVFFESEFGNDAQIPLSPLRDRVLLVFNNGSATFNNGYSRSNSISLNGKRVIYYFYAISSGGLVNMLGFKFTNVSSKYLS